MTFEGQVAFWNPVRGYGFIKSPDSSRHRDLFFHATRLDCAEEKVSVGAIVSYSLKESEKGPYAVQVKVLEPEE